MSKGKQRISNQERNRRKLQSHAAWRAKHPQEAQMQDIITRARVRRALGIPAPDCRPRWLIWGEYL